MIFVECQEKSGRFAMLAGSLCTYVIANTNNDKLEVIREEYTLLCVLFRGIKGGPFTVNVDVFSDPHTNLTHLRACVFVVGIISWVSRNI